jgi:UDP-N-acetylmuramoyl-L-alanyl-D-glutamate--2,6-diaminopimelate ligase
MQLNQLLQAINLDSIEAVDIFGLCTDSRQVVAGDCFLAFPGLNSDGRDYIEQAVAAGATAILYEKKGASDVSVDVPAIAVEGLSEKVGLIASCFYHYPGECMHIVGITGTNGKTSVSHALAQAYEILGKKAVVMGTLGVGPISDLTATGMTTPDALSVQKNLAGLLGCFTRDPADKPRDVGVEGARDVGVEGARDVGTPQPTPHALCAGSPYLAMEVSSHALAQHRVVGVPIETAVYTQLSPEHLDYHGDMETYAQCKEKLFQFPHLQHAIINADDTWGARWIERYCEELPVVAYTMGHPAGDLTTIPTVRCESFSALPGGAGYSLQLSTPWGNGESELHLLGEYNITNALAVVATLGAQGFAWSSILALLPKIKAVPGRMQWFRHPSGASAVVDFAHTPDALQQVLKTLRPLCQGELRCVFGCGGDRDASKREVMGQMAAAIADKIWITNDNPRTESPEKIAESVRHGCGDHPAVQIELDRGKAIAAALTTVGAHDIILVAGKGHEIEQIIGTTKQEFSDIECVRSLCNEGV